MGRATAGDPRGGPTNLHYVLDIWAQQWRQRQAQGDMIIVRWADDFVVGFQYRKDAQRFLTELRDRFQKFSLELHPEKTRLIRFGRFARLNSQCLDGRSKPETFNFLGFTHYCGVNRNGKFIVGRITMRERPRAKLHEVKSELRNRMHRPIPEQGAWLAAVVRGYFNYHAIPGNWDALKTFRTLCTRLWFKALGRRSQKRRLNWKRMIPIVERWLPHARILPFPEQRLAAIIQCRSRVH